MAWWSAIEVLISYRVTNARTEAANTDIKHIKRTGRGYRNPAQYQARILLTSAAQHAERRMNEFSYEDRGSSFDSLNDP